MLQLLQTFFFFVCFCFLGRWYCVIAGYRGVSVTVVMYYTMAQKKRNPSVLKCRCTKCRHYNIFEVMQYKPQYATFQFKEVYLLIWLIAVGWNDKVVLCILDDCTYTVYWQKDVWNFIACVAYEGGLFDNFTFYISCLDCDMIDIFSP